MSAWTRADHEAFDALLDRLFDALLEDFDPLASKGDEEVFAYLDAHDPLKLLDASERLAKG